MRTIEVSDEVYAEIQQNATERGVTVEEFVVALAMGDSETRRHFTAEFIAEQHRIADEMAAGGEAYSTDQVWANLQAHKTARKAVAS